MRIGVPKEVVPGERRVALVPDGVGRITRGGAEVVVERGAGEAAGFLDEQYAAAGAVLGDADAALGADLVAKVQRPADAEVARLREGAAVVSLLVPASNQATIERLAARRVTAFALELVPRITRAQSMDVLSSQATVGGYKAVLLGAEELPKLLPMLTTAAGTLAPARVFVIGAGVAGLQAIATARRLGAIVSGYDIRPAAAEQVQSLGASFVGTELLSHDAETAGGYAKEQTPEQRARAQELVAAHVAEQDLVITTAQIPGRPAPRLVTAETVRRMRPGSVIVDMAAESGGNCELTRAGERVVERGVVILGPVNIPATVPLHASQMFSRNIETFVKHIVKDGALAVDLGDEITGAMCVTHEGAVR